MCVCVCSIWPPLRGGKCMQWSLSLPKTLVAMDRKLPAPGAGVEGLPRRLWRPWVWPLSSCVFPSEVHPAFLAAKGPHLKAHTVSKMRTHFLAFLQNLCSLLNSGFSAWISFPCFQKDVNCPLQREWLLFSGANLPALGLPLSAAGPSELQESPRKSQTDPPLLCTPQPSWCSLLLELTSCSWAIAKHQFSEEPICQMTKSLNLWFLWTILF